MSEPIPDLIFSDGRSIPQVGLGVFQVPPDDTARVVLDGLDVGYRHIDTAEGYHNESGVGRAIEESGIPRDEIFVTTKLENSQQGYDATLRRVDQSLRDLRLESVDLLLIHWPVPAKNLYVETWKAFVRMQEEGRVKSVGVSNFLPEHIERLLDETGVAPVVNQIELHPYLQQKELRAFDEEHHILTEAWSPLARGQVASDPVLQRIADKHGKTPSQVVLRWHLQIGNVVIPKSVHKARQRENIDLFDFELDDEDLAAIGGLDRGLRTGPDPRTFG